MLARAGGDVDHDLLALLEAALSVSPGMPDTVVEVSEVEGSRTTRRSRLASRRNRWRFRPAEH